MDYALFAGLAALLAAVVSVVAYEVKLRVARARMSAQTSEGFIALAPLATTLGSAALSAILSGAREAANAGATVAAAAITALPGILKAIGTSPLWAFLAGGLLFGFAGLLGGSHLRHNLDSDAVRAALKAQAPGVQFSGDVAKVKADAKSFVVFVVKRANDRAAEAIATAKTEAVAAANKKAEEAIAKARADTKIAAKSPAPTSKKAR